MKATVLLVLIMSMSVTGPRASGGDDQKPFNLTTLLGETFQHCRIIKVTPEGITVSHDNGVSKIPFDNLNDEWKKLFHYSPEKADAFQKEEAARIAAAEEKRRQARKNQEQAQSRQLEERVAAENRPWLNLAEAIVQQQVKVAAAIAVATPTQPGLLVPRPVDPTPYFVAGLLTSRIPPAGASGTTAQSNTEVLIPATTPIGQVFTPGATGTQRFIINQGTIFTPGDGTVYFGNSGWVTPPSVVCPPTVLFPPTVVSPPRVVCPPSTVRPVPLLPGSGVTIRPGTGSVRILR